MTNRSIRVRLFVTCPVDLFCATVGFAAVKLLERCSYAIAAERMKASSAHRLSLSMTRLRAVPIALGTAFPP